MKIAFVGASKYGNVGDDTYPLVFREQFPDAELLFFNSDLPEMLPGDVDLLVLGGGGILHTSKLQEHPESPHFRCMRFYMDWAASRGIPWGVLSCGFQFEIGREASYAIDLAPWIPYLRQAHFITLRSPECVRIARELSGREDGIHFFPDAAYLFRPPVITREDSSSGERIVTLIPAGLINPRNKHTQHVIRLFKSMDYELVWLSMGASVDDGEHLEAAARREPQSHIVSKPTPAEAFAQIARSRMVLSGRYHGMIFARTLGVPFYVPEYSPYKIQQEDLQADPRLAHGHVRTLQEMMDRVACTVPG